MLAFQCNWGKLLRLALGLANGTTETSRHHVFVQESVFADQMVQPSKFL
jgi:hypothetical protein